MACTLCQNLAYTNEIMKRLALILPKLSFKLQGSVSIRCVPPYHGSSLTLPTRIFPQGYVLADNASIPYWAIINPGSWLNELFNTVQAQGYANQSQPAYYPSSSSTNSSSSSSGSGTNVGAIVGGSVGGAVGFLLILIGGYFLYKHIRGQRANNTSLITHKPTLATSMHTRWPSEPSTLFSATSMGPPPASYTTMQPQQVGMGMSVLSPTSYSSFQGASPPPPTDTASFLTTRNMAAQRPHAVPIV
ncbi:hypothetical protein J3R82DRAFT_2969 [Butyriboletus roseoflavus]|nr:hypothetical protein J3R82DRAFT_2969 [Butyriboletus roseoflavus]